MGKQKKNNMPVEADSSDLRKRDDYINHLEISVQLLQREVEDLRNQRLVQPSLKIEETNFNFERNLLNLLSSCRTDVDVLNVLQGSFSHQYGLIESIIYYISESGKITNLSGLEASERMKEIIGKFVEEGVIDWAIESRVPKIIPNLYSGNADVRTYIIITPLILRGSAIGVFASISSRSPESFTKDEMALLVTSAEQTAITIDNIKSAEEIKKMNKRLKILNNRMMQSNKFVSFGSLAASVAGELSNPIQIIKANLQLIETGVGDSKVRINIIKENLENINKIISRLSGFSENSDSDLKLKPINLCRLIDEVILFSSSQLLRDGIKVDKEFDEDTPMVLGVKPQLEQVILSLLLKARDSMPDGGTINVGVFKQRTNRAGVTISDSGTGLSDDEIKTFFDPGDSPENIDKGYGIEADLLKSIIKELKGEIKISSEQGKGTTIKIILPGILSK
jgi:signal transduction histidine kinase